MKSSSWTALRNPIFRKLWFATVISGTCVAAHDSAATWMLNAFAASPFLADRRGTGQIRGKVKEDENGIRIADARSLSSETGEGGGVAKQIGEDP